METTSPISPPAGGSITGPGAMPSGLIEAAWIAAFLGFILWLAHLLFQPLVNRLFTPKEGGEGGTEAAAAAGEGAGTGATDQQEHPTSRRANFLNKLNKMTRASRDAFLITFGLVVASIAGFGIPVATLVLIWVVFFLLCWWILVQVCPNSVAWILDFLLTLPFAVLSIIIWARAFKDAPSYFAR
ncbi:hypothetical protein HDV00_008125 [Rhizophlyctis rosea]|nr:hypothetical protein HDV00_008125 [Rhizophlyctis rosea]